MGMSCHIHGDLRATQGSGLSNRQSGMLHRGIHCHTTSVAMIFEHHEPSMSSDKGYLPNDKPIPSHPNANTPPPYNLYTPPSPSLIPTISYSPPPSLPLPFPFPTRYPTPSSPPLPFPFAAAAAPPPNSIGLNSLHRQAHTPPPTIKLALTACSAHHNQCLGMAFE